MHDTSGDQISTKCNFTFIHHKAVHIEFELQSVEQVAAGIPGKVHTKMRHSSILRLPANDDNIRV